jgi:hypothetical protein
VNPKERIDKLVELALHPTTPTEEARTSAMAALKEMRKHSGEITLLVEVVVTLYARLKSGEWGIRCSKKLQLGQQVVVSKRDGTTSVEQVTQLIGKDRGAWLYSIASADSSNDVVMSTAQTDRRCTQCAEFIAKGSIVFQNTGQTRCLCTYCANA